MNVAVDLEAAEGAVRALLYAVGEDPEREGLRDTPQRVARAYAELLDYDPGTLDTAFPGGQVDQMIAVSGMRVWSLCEHHLLPFWCDVTAAYLPHGRLLGLSKVGRVVEKHAHRLQIQERLVEGVADELEELTGSDDVAVLASGEHLCMSMRGVRLPARMTSSVLRGAFRDDPAARAEFFALAHAHGGRA